MCVQAGLQQACVFCSSVCGYMHMWKCRHPQAAAGGCMCALHCCSQHTVAVTSAFIADRPPCPYTPTIRSLCPLCGEQALAAKSVGTIELAAGTAAMPATHLPLCSCRPPALHVVWCAELVLRLHFLGCLLQSRHTFCSHTSHCLRLRNLVCGLVDHAYAHTPGSCSSCTVRDAICECEFSVCVSLRSVRVSRAIGLCV